MDEFSKQNNSQAVSSNNTKDVPDINYRLKAGLFLTSVTGISACVAFAMTLAAAKKKDPKMFQKGTLITGELQETGVELALRALKWGTFYAISGCSLVCLGIWKMSGAHSMEEFRYKMGSVLPKIPKNEVPQSRTEFTGINDLLTYISSDFGKESHTKRS